MHSKNNLNDSGLPRLNTAFFPTLLLVSVYGFAISLLLGRGTYEPALYLCMLAVAGLLVWHRSVVRIERSVLILLGLALVLFVQGCAMAGGQLTGGFHTVLLWSMLMFTAVQLLPERFGACYRLTHANVSTALLVLFVAVQVVAYSLNVHKAGLFSNIHYLALYSVITSPVLFYRAAHAKTVFRWVLVLAVVGDFWLLLKTQSRPGFLALLAGSMATVPFLSVRYRLVALGAILVLPAVLYFAEIFGFAARINDLIVNFSNEERPAIWRETLSMLSQNTVPEWWFGHGFGRFFWDYQSFSSFHDVEDFSFPHNFFLELLYSHGITGLLVVVLAYVLLYRQLVVATSTCRDASLRPVGIVLISVVTADLVHGFLTLPLFSRHNLYPLSLILGASLLYFRKSTSQ